MYINAKPKQPIIQASHYTSVLLSHQNVEFSSTEFPTLLSSCGYAQYLAAFSIGPSVIAPGTVTDCQGLPRPHLYRSDDNMFA